MYWIIENNVAEEELYDAFIEAVEKAGIEYAIVKKVPFSNIIHGSFEEDRDDIIVYGSVSLCFNVAPERGWKVYTNENFDYEVWSEKWKGYVLNDDVEIGPFQSVPINHEQFFIRPCKDNKAFTGLVCSLQYYLHWKEQLEKGFESSAFMAFDLNEQVMVSPVKNIEQEIRFYVVNGKIVTHSQYKRGIKVHYAEESSTSPDAVEFAQKIIDIWQPDDAFVLDLALSNGEYKVLEINCINSAGLYKCDVTKLVDAFLDLENFKETSCHHIPKSVILTPR